MVVTLLIPLIQIHLPNGYLMRILWRRGPNQEQEGNNIIKFNAYFYTYEGNVNICIFMQYNEINCCLMCCFSLVMHSQQATG